MSPPMSWWPPRGTFYQGYRCSRCRAPAHKECLGRLGTCGRAGAGERGNGAVGALWDGEGALWDGEWDVMGWGMWDVMGWGMRDAVR